MPTVTLRPMRQDDVPAMAAWGEDPEFVAAAEWGVRTPPARRVFWQRVLDAPPPDLIRLAAVLDRTLVGHVDLHGTEPDRRELGFVIARPYWGRGVGTAAARAGLAYGFGELGLERIWAEAWATNAASVAILDRLMRRTGTGKDGHYRGSPTHYVQFEISREEWFAG